MTFQFEPIICHNVKIEQVWDGQSSGVHIIIIIIIIIINIIINISVHPGYQGGVSNSYRFFTQKPAFLPRFRDNIQPYGCKSSLCLWTRLETSGRLGESDLTRD